MSRKKKGTQRFIQAVSVSVISASSSVALAGPSGGVAVAGGISIGTMNNNELVITQALQKGIINWADFSIDAGELVRFAQNAGNDSITLNRVLGSQVSNIQGALQANGNIFLINPNGIVFGAGSQVDAAGLLATTFDVDDQSFLNGGQLSFTQVAGKDLASISNQGQITADTGGFIYLVAPKVDNSGFVIANVGRVTMAAGDRFTINLQGSNLINFSVSADTLAAATGEDLKGVSNSGTVKGDTVLLQGNSASGLMSSVVNNSGVIEATDLTISAGDIVQNNTIKGVGTAAATTATLTAGKTITTGGNSSTRATTLNLEVTGENASIGAEGAALSVDADVLNATAASGHVLVTDTSGGVALGDVKAGTPAAGGSVVITAQNGSITSADTSKTNVSGYSAKFVADVAVGSDSTAVNTKVGVLSASTQNGGINVNNSGALILGDVIAREQITVNNQTSSSAAVDNSGSITLSNGSAGTKNVKIRASEGVILTGTVSATNGLDVSSGTGSILAAQAGTSLVGRTVNLSSGSEVGHVFQALSTQSNTVNASAGNGGVYLSESNGLTVGTITAAGTGNNVALNAVQGNITVGSITATGGSVSLSAGNGSVISASGSTTNVTAEELIASGKSGIGTSSKSLGTSVDTLTATTSAAQASVYATNNKALSTLSVTTPNGDTNVSFTGGSLVYSRNLNSLTLNRIQALDLSFANTASGFKLNGIDAGTNKNVSLTAAGNITQGSGAVVGRDVAIDASGNIGAADTALQTQASTLNLTSRNGSVNVSNTSGELTVKAKATSTNGAVTLSQSGNLAVSSVAAKTAVALSVGGAVTTAADAVGSAISAGSLNLSGSSIGTSAKALSSQVIGAVDLSASTGDINYSNTGAISLLDVLATSGSVVFHNVGDVVVGKVEAGGTVNFTVSGNVTDGNGSAANFITSGLTAAVNAFGSSADAIEIQVDELVVDTVNGGIYARQSNGSLLSLVRATSQGSGSDIQIAADGSLKLGNVDAGGRNVSLTAGGSIEDGRSIGNTLANVTGRELTMNASTGIGQQGSLALDVSALSATSGGAGVSVTNAGALAVNNQTLVGKGFQAINIVAAGITVLDNGGATLTMDGGTLNLTATQGNIVFLNQNDTIYLPGGGSITLTAMYKSPVAGHDGVIIAGNLKTDGGDITLQAQSNITLGLLDAGTTGNVTVSSTSGSIIDGNGTAENIRANNVSLNAGTVSRSAADINRSTAIADYSVLSDEAATKLQQLNILIQQLKDYEDLVTSTTPQKSLAELTQRLAEISMTAQASKVQVMEATVDDLNAALNAAAVVRNAAAVIAAVDQDIPFSADAGADAAFAVVDQVVSAANAALDSYERYSLAPQQDLLVELTNTLSVANAAVVTAASNLASATSIRNTTAASKNTTELAVFKADIARDAALKVRDQAIKAYGLNQQIDSSALKPLGITANRLDINSGAVTDGSLYLDSTGSLGLGNINVAAGQQLVADATGQLNVIGNVSAGQAIDLTAGQAILGQGGQLTTTDLRLSSGGSISSSAGPLGIQAQSLNAHAAGAINLRETDNLNIGVVESSQGDISIAAGGSLNLGSIVAGAGNDNVALTAGNQITNATLGTAPNVRANNLTMSSAYGMGADRALLTQVGTLNATVTHAGNIALDEMDGFDRLTLNSANGDVSVVSRSGDILLDAVSAVGRNVSLRAQSGGIYDLNNNAAANVTADSLDMRAGNGIGQPANPFDIDVARVSAYGGNGGVYLNSLRTTPLTLSSGTGDALSASAGDIVLNAAGDLNIAGNVTHAGTGNISLGAVNIVQNANITTQSSGNIALKGNQDVRMAANAVTSTGTGNIRYEAGRVLAVSTVRTESGTGRILFVAPEVIDLLAETPPSPPAPGNDGEQVPPKPTPPTVTLIGTNLAESRRFMDALLQPLMSQLSPHSALLSGGPLSATQIRPQAGFVEGDNGEMTYGK